jgi:hypothetical protein
VENGLIFYSAGKSSKMNFKFYSFENLRDPKHEGSKLLNVLTELYEEAFGYLYLRVNIKENMTYRSVPINSKISGLYVMKVDKKIVCFANLLNAVIDRIFTIPKYRNRGYATQMLSIMRGISMWTDEYSLISPVDQHVVHIYEKAGWVKYNEIVNKDGSTDMVSNEQAVSDFMDMKMWRFYLNEMC